MDDDILLLTLKRYREASSELSHCLLDGDLERAAEIISQRERLIANLSADVNLMSKDWDNSKIGQIIQELAAEIAASDQHGLQLLDQGLADRAQALSALSKTKSALGNLNGMFRMNRTPIVNFRY